MMDKRQADTLIRQAGWLAETPIEFQDQVLAKCDLLRFKKAELIYDAGDETGGAFGVVDGHVEVHVPSPGVDATLSYIGGLGFWFGDLAAFTGRHRRVAVIAGSDSRLFRLSRADIAHLTGRDPSVWRYFMVMMARNLRLAMSTVFVLKQSDPLKRVAAMLLVLVEDAGKGEIRVPASQWDLAELTHLGRSKVNASLAALETRGYVRRRYGSIEVVDAVALQDFVLGAGEQSPFSQGNPAPFDPRDRRAGARPNS
jgi:CRP/FNR family transcriptional regulator, cyclic AMP receptor protein